MAVFYQEEPTNHPKRCKCKCLAAALKDAFTYCNKCKRRKVCMSGREDEYPMSDFDYEQEVVFSEIRSRAMEKLKQKPKIRKDSFSRILFDPTKEPNITTKEANHKEGNEEEDERNEFLTVRSCFSECSSALSREAFVSAKTKLSRCGSLNGSEFENPWRIYLQDFQKRSMIQEFGHCEGWPFGLGRKAVLLPPLPKSPSESWAWSKRTGIAKTP